MIQISDVTKVYGARRVLDNISFVINSGERVALVGRNGHGKTTLFRIITNEEAPDNGTVTIPKKYRIGYLSQHISLSQNTLLEEAALGLPSDSKEDLWKVKKMLSGLGFTDDDFDRDPKEFSGGYQLRIALTKVLISEPNLLLLDEPTNFLDIVSIRYLESFLKSWKNELIVISHDRSFLDSVTTHTMGIHRAKLRKIQGSTGSYYTQIEQDEEVYEKQRVNVERKQKQMQEFITKFRAKARQASLAQSRAKALEKQEVKDKLKKIATLSFSFNYDPFSAKNILEARDISFSYDKNLPLLINQFSLNVLSHDRICIIGKNGKGKTTLLKLLSGKLSPLSGDIRNHPKAQRGYFEQANTVNLNEDLTIEEELIASHPTGDRAKIRNICGAMMFPGDDALKKISILSGGEKSRVLLGKLLISPSNLLLLDEPTHHLDIESCEAMIDALDAFPGAMIMVTHNEHILFEVATKLIVFRNNDVVFYPGNYEDFLNKMGWEDEIDTTPQKTESKFDRKELKRKRAEFVRRRSSALKQYEEKILGLEKNIEELEDALSQDNEALISASTAQDADAIMKFSKSVQDITKQIEPLYEMLAETTDAFENEKHIFEQEEKMLNELSIS